MLAAEREVARQQGCQIVFDLVKEVEPLKNNYHVVRFLDILYYKVYYRIQEN